MKKLPNILNTSKFKYNIIARLILLEGGESNLSEKKQQLIQYLGNHPISKNTIRKWFVIEKGVKTEIPFTVLFSICEFFNEKYQMLYSKGKLEELELINAEDLFNEGQLVSKL